MYLKNDTITVTIGNTVFRSFNTANPQFVLDETALSGWDDGVVISRGATVRPNGYGDFPETGKLSSRIVTLTGIAVADDLFGLHYMRDTFTGLLNDGGFSTISVRTENDTRYATMALSAQPSWIQQSDTIAAFKITLYSADSRIYGEDRNIQIGVTNTSGGLKYDLAYPLNFYVPSSQQLGFITNRGNSVSWPVCTVTGDYTQGFSITDNLGKTVTYAGPVSMNAPVVIDMAAGSATQSGIDKSVNFTNRQWISIPAGQSIQPSFIPNEGGAGWCDILYRDTWI